MKLQGIGDCLNSKYCLMAHVVLSCSLLALYCHTKHLLEECKALHMSSSSKPACISLSKYLHVETEFFKLCLETRDQEHYVANNAQEVIRRISIRGINQMVTFIQGQVKALLLGKITVASTKADLRLMLSLLKQHKSFILNKMNNLNKLYGSSKWRKNKETELGNLIQRRLTYIQNPKNCSVAKKLLCHFVPCGYGCQMHQLVFCLLTSYAMNRTVVVNFSKWRYNGSLDAFYEPLSNTCNYTSELWKKGTNWPGRHADIVIRMPVMRSMSPLPPYMFPAIPSDLANDIVQIKEEPFAWWIGQLFKYALRPTKNLTESINQLIEKIDYKQPIVGIHVRRTDKLNFAPVRHGLNEYMDYAEEFFGNLKMLNPNVTKRVYLATDDSRILTEAWRRYPKYTFLTSSSAGIAKDITRRFSESGLVGIIIDIHMLSRCSFLVCTFSSHVCRMSYVIMQTLNPEAWTNYRSLDRAYYFTPNAPLHQVAVQSYKWSLNGHIALKPGDIISINSNNVKGFVAGRNLRTNKTGRFPSFAAVDTIPTFAMPTYPEVEKAP